MQKLGDISLKNTVAVKVDCQINEQIVVNNFKIIIECLNELKQKQDTHSKQFDKNSEKFNNLEQQLSNLKSLMNSNSGIEKVGNQSQINQNLSPQQLQNFNGRLAELEKKTEKNSNGILDNIKDINLINKDISEIKELLNQVNSNANFAKASDIKQEKSNINASSIPIGDVNDLNNMKKDIQKNTEEINKLKGQLDSLKDLKKFLEQKIKELQEKNSQFSNFATNNKDLSDNNGQNSQGLDKAYMNDLRDRISVLQKKSNALQNKNEQNQSNIQSLKNFHEALNNNYNKLKEEIQNLKRMLEQLGGFNKDDWSKLLKQLEKLKKQMESLKKDQIGSKTSIEEDRKYDKASYTQTRFGKDDDKLKDLQTRIEHLQKLIGSKRSIEDDSKSNQEKLPLIKRPQRRQRDTSYHDKSSVKKDMNEIKMQLQNWMNNYLASNKTKDNLEDLELKIQELRNLVGRKADQEGLRKGLTFLESKINQLYLFLTEPDGEDAMIVRKGFNCLSCSKKVQHLRGKIGPHINWNNMTATNYSPPKVGYSKQMGENTPDRDDDL